MQWDTVSAVPYKGVCRSALATPGLLKTETILTRPSYSVPISWILIFEDIIMFGNLFSFDNISVLMTFQLCWQSSFGETSVLWHFRFGDILVLVTYQIWWYFSVLVIFQFWWCISFHDISCFYYLGFNHISVLLTFPLLWNFSFWDVSVLVTFQFWFGPP